MRWGRRGPQTNKAIIGSETGALSAAVDGDASDAEPAKICVIADACASLRSPLLQP